MTESTSMLYNGLAEMLAMSNNDHLASNDVVMGAYVASCPISMQVCTHE